MKGFKKFLALNRNRILSHATRVASTSTPTPTPTPASTGVLQMPRFGLLTRNKGRSGKKTKAEKRQYHADAAPARKVPAGKEEEGSVGFGVGFCTVLVAANALVVCGESKANEKGESVVRGLAKTNLPEKNDGGDDDNTSQSDQKRIFQASQKHERHASSLFRKGVMAPRSKSARPTTVSLSWQDATRPLELRVSKS